MLLVLILIVFLTLNHIYDKESLRIIITSINNINPVYILIGLLIVISYFTLHGSYVKIMLKTLKQDISLRRGIFYSLVEFYFSGITPSATGGQPVELYYMTKDKIPVRNSYIVLILNTISFKVTLLILGILVLIFKGSYIFSNNTIYILCFFIGFIADIILVTMYLFLLFNKKLIKTILSKLYAIGKHIKKLNNFLEKRSIDNIMDKYSNELQFIKDNKKTVFITFIITFIQRVLMFSIAYIVYRALGFSEYNYFDLLTIQISVQLAIEVMPLPGGAWLSENMIYSMFVMIFAEKYSDVGMLLTRTFSFYIPIIISGFIILMDAIIKKEKPKKNIS